MIYLTRLNGEKIAVNIDLIEFMEETPDTVVTLTTGRKFVVRETMENIREEVIKFKKASFTNLKK
ncbi:flagellar FlbD family protein [Thermosyntropha sp.]|uniref:flagellar FlbD family protein n=1 Tax=Thermosyntropha sp. TaxID=2740820 RepID=UPI0025CC2D19|nr:flagellar FlbD family protein [Thermosyntropha sp.]MBO8159356.1 flagellar FlbD family protein [Thermosyntropha sp.]